MKTMRLAFLAFLVPLSLAAQSPPPVPASPYPAVAATERPLLARVAEEADAMAQNIAKTLSIETLEQRSAGQPARARPRFGAAPAAHPGHLTVRQIVSEYSVGAWRETDSRDLHEFRQILSVDGLPIQTEETARHTLSLGMQSPSDRIRKRLLQQLASFGLVDIATDYGLILLEFTRRGWENLQFGSTAEARLGTSTALVLSWKQRSTAGGELEFHGRQVVRQPLEGRLWMRRSDGLPLRVEAWAEVRDGGHTVRDQASVEYAMSSHGFLTPASVLHRHSVDGQVMTENLYRYQPFKMFRADAAVKFTGDAEPSPAARKP
jgi:hypothetical protein